MNTDDNQFGYELTETYDASRQRVFTALTDATTLKRIWGVQEISVDAQVGGKTHAVYIAEGKDWSFTITYTEVIPNQTLRWITRFKSFPTKETRVTVLLKDVDKGTELTIRMENFETAAERDANRQAWERGLASLAGILKTL